MAGTAGAGVRVEARQTGQARAIPASIDLSAFRIVQEALTNVVKHSGADHCQVAVAYGADDLRVEITDPGAHVPAPAGAWPCRAHAGGRVGAGRVARAGDRARDRRHA